MNGLRKIKSYLNGYVLLIRKHTRLPIKAIYLILVGTLLFIYFHFFTGLKEGDAVKVKFKNGRGYLTDIFKYYYRGETKNIIFFSHLPNSKVFEHPKADIEFIEKY